LAAAQKLHRHKIIKLFVTFVLQQKFQLNLNPKVKQTVNVLYELLRYTAKGVCTHITYNVHGTSCKILLCRFFGAQKKQQHFNWQDSQAQDEALVDGPKD
jgi:hypothetical protein